MFFGIFLMLYPFSAALKEAMYWVSKTGKSPKNEGIQGDFVERCGYTPSFNVNVRIVMSR